MMFELEVVSLNHLTGITILKFQFKYVFIRTLLYINNLKKDLKKDLDQDFLTSVLLKLGPDDYYFFLG